MTLQGWRLSITAPRTGSYILTRTVTSTYAVFTIRLAFHFTGHSCGAIPLTDSRANVDILASSLSLE